MCPRGRTTILAAHLTRRTEVFPREGPWSHLLHFCAHVLLPLALIFPPCLCSELWATWTTRVRCLVVGVGIHSAHFITELPAHLGKRSVPKGNAFSLPNKMSFLASSAVRAGTGRRTGVSAAAPVSRKQPPGHHCIFPGTNTSRADTSISNAKLIIIIKCTWFAAVVIQTDEMPAPHPDLTSLPTARMRRLTHSLISLSLKG